MKITKHVWWFLLPHSPRSFAISVGTIARQCGQLFVTVHRPNTRISITENSSSAATTSSEKMIINDMFWNISFCKNTVILAENLAITQHCIDKTFSINNTIWQIWYSCQNAANIFWNNFWNLTTIYQLLENFVYWTNKKIQLTISESILLKQLLIRNGHIPSKYCKTSTIFWQ